MLRVLITNFENSARDMLMSNFNTCMNESAEVNLASLGKRQKKSHRLLTE